MATHPEKQTPKKEVRKYRWLRRIIRTLLGIIIFLLLLVLFIRSPWGQDLIVQQAVSYVKDKTGTEVSVDQLYFTFGGDIRAEGVYLEDKKGDTLIYSRSLEADIPLLPIITGGGISVNKLDWDGLKARIKRKDTINGFNFEFLQEAFATAPDTTASAPLEISIGKVQLTDFDIVFNDDVEGLYTTAIFDRLDLTMDNLDLEGMVYAIDEIKLQDAKIDFTMNPPVTVEGVDGNTTVTDSTTTDPAARLLPLLSANKITLLNTNFNFNAPKDGISVKSAVPELITSIETADLEKQIYKVSQLDLVRANVEVLMTEEPASSGTTAEPFVFEWPAMQVEVGDVNISETDFQYYLNGARPQLNVFNPDAIALTDLNFKSSRFDFEDKKMEFAVEELSGNEASGIMVHELELDGIFSDQQIAINNIKTRINRNSLSGSFKMEFASLNAFISNPENLKIAANLPSFKVDINDVFRFQPDLKNNPYMKSLARHRLAGNFIATGSTEFLRIPNLKVRWGAATTIYGTGSLKNLTDPETLSYDFSKVKFVSSRSDLNLFVDEKDLGVELPQQITLAGSFKGSTSSLVTDSKLTTTLGNVDLEGDFKFGDVIEFDTTVKAMEINLAQILQNPSLGNLTIDLKAKGSGTGVNDLDASLQSTIASFSYNGYDINNVPINGSFADGEGEVTSQYRDDNLDMTLESQIALDSIATTANVDIDVKGVDLRAFGISSQNVKAGGKINAFYKGDFENYILRTSIEDGIAVFDDQSYLLGKVAVAAYVQPDSTSVDVKNKMLDLKLRSNTDPAQLIAALQRHVDRYLTDEVSMDTIQPVVMSIKGKLSPTPILRDVILPSLEALDTVTIAVDFNEMERRLNTDIVLPYVKYAGSEIDSLKIISRSNAREFSFDLGFRGLSSGPVLLKKTNLTGNIAQNILVIDFLSYDGDEKLMHFGSTLSRKQDELGVPNLVFNLSLDDLILNRKPWSIPEDNEMAIGEKVIKFQNFKLSSEGQSLELRSDIPRSEKDHVALLLKDFRLQSLLAYVNPESKLASGRVNGELILEDVLGKMGFIADLTIDDFYAMETELGKLSLDASLVEGDLYEMDLKVKGTNVDLDLTGNYKASINDAQLDLKLEINRLNMETIAGLSQEMLKDGSGYLTGNISLTGTTLDPVYDGTIGFKDAGVNIAMLNNKFNMRDEQIKLNNDAITFNNFKIRDEDGNVFSVDGNVGTKDLLTPTFDLKLKAKNFTALNSTAEDNDLYYGKATFDATATIGGNIDVPVVDMTVNIDDATNFTYVIPASELDVVQRDGIVQFVNKEDPDAILTKTEEESATLTGFDINMAIKINNGAKVNIIVDPATGDNLQVSGNGDLRFKMTPNGRMTLTGRYEINDGFYELSLYEIVTRRFELVKGGSVSWSGDPFDANLDVRALYRVETSASALMAAQTSGADVNTGNQFQNEFPFLVYLNVKGELMKPEISFKLDLPEDEQGAVGGQVYSRIQQLNNQDQELNKQVFSLLTLNRFFPTSGSDGSSGGAATIARDNLNQALSDQLNQFGGKLLGNSGVDLNFGLDSYTDYQGSGTQDRTQLDVTASKKLLDDRLIVSVGSEVDIQGSAAEGEETPIIGNVSLEYLLTSSGQWRLKGFRKNQFDNVIDGQLVVSGVALIFTKEFNKFKNLFRKTVREEEEKARREEEELKEKQDREKEEQRIKERQEEK